MSDDSQKQEPLAIPAEPTPGKGAALRTFFRRPPALFGGVVLGLLTIGALWPTRFLPHDPRAGNLGDRFLPPGAEHWLGTDALGRDILSVMVAGSRYTLMIVLGAALLGLVIGVVMGLLAGYFGGVVDSVVGRLADIQLAFPVLVLLIAVIAAFGPSLANLIWILGLTAWAPYARLVRGVVLALREREFIEAATAIGLSHVRIMARHILPNCVSTLLVFATFELARLVLLEAALSFLGLGVQPPTPSWGALIAESRQYISSAWWASAIPGAIIMVAVLAFNLLGDEIRDALDPTSRRRTN